MMFLYVCLILLPAAAMAVCDDSGVWAFFNAVDKDNNGVINRREAYFFFKTVDINADLIITIQEAKERVPIVAPGTAGHIEELFRLLDIDKDEYISYCDLEADFKLIDKNGDGVKSKSEYQILLKQICGAGAGLINISIGKW